MKNVKKYLKMNRNGITLIALVIIIIVLLIVASISISILTGDNGIIKRSKESKSQHEIAGEKEILKLATSEAYTEDAKNSKDKTVKVNANTLKNVLDDYDEIDSDKTKVADDGVEAVFKKSGRLYTVNLDGNVTEGSNRKPVSTITKKDGTKIEIYKDSTNEEIKQIAQEIYGEQVDYQPAGDKTGKYRVFYIEDQDNTFGDGVGTIYLKRDYEDLSIMADGDQSATLYSKAITSKYTQNTSSDAYETMKKMNPKWSNGGATSLDDKNKRGEVPFDKLNDGEKASIWLCDESNWTRFYDSEKANYVIGSPSLEMYCKSYNNVLHNGKTNVKLGTEYNIVKGYPTGYGYRYTINGKLENELSSFNTDYILDYNSYNRMYCNYYKKVNWGGNVLEPRWWLASPVDDDAYHVYTVDSQLYNFEKVSTNNAHGVCPIVALKSGISLSI